MKGALVNEKPVVIGFAYTLPSDFSIHEQFEDTLFELIGDEILKYQKMGLLYLVGDLNEESCSMTI